MFAYGSEFYEISDEDVAGTIQYFGYLNQIGKWIICKRDASGAPVTDRYVNGAVSYATNWGNRAILSYDYYNKMSNTTP